MNALPDPQSRLRRRSLLALPAWLLGACATLTGAEPLRVSVIDLQTLPASGFETRMLVRLRVQNPTGRVLPYQGVSLEVDLQGMQIASGVSATGGKVPAFGDVLIDVPVTLGSLSLLRQTLSLTNDVRSQRLRVICTARGRLAGRPLDSERFEGRSEVEWPPRPAPNPGAG